MTGLIKQFFQELLATLTRLFVRLSWAGVSLSILAVAGLFVGMFVYNRLAEDLPDYQHLADYQPPTTTRIHAGDGRLLAEFANERRVFVPAKAIPALVKNAFIAAEDKRFYNHAGVDPIGITRAAIAYARDYGTGKRPQGASTITQQVAKNFLLSNELRLERKAKEAILSMRMEKSFTKDQILELYLNQIYLGNRSHGVAAAAMSYFGKALGDLTIAEAAFLAAMPKAPSRYHPEKNYRGAIGRRNYVINRMEEDGYITQAEAEAARNEPIILSRRNEGDLAKADFFAEEVRRQLVREYGYKGFYEGGLSIRTTIEPRLQQLADRALRDGLFSFDRQHGYRGPLASVNLEEIPDWIDYLSEFEPGFDLYDWSLGIVLGTGGDNARIGLANGREVSIALRHLSWARTYIDDESIGPPITKITDVLNTGDIITLTEVETENEGIVWGLRQKPAVDGALVAVDPHNGRVLAMAGGFSFDSSQFNRATQAQRQPGSAFKPFVYLAALENGKTPASIILDAPLVIDQGAGLPKWKPVNYSDVFYGPSTLRLGIEKSRNLMTARLADEIGMAKVVDVARRFSVDRGLGYNLAASLGSNEVDPLTLTTAYAMLVNGGKKIEPALIERIQDRFGKSIAKRDERLCTECQMPYSPGSLPPDLTDNREQVVDARHAYQMVHILEGVVERGTAVRAKAVGKPLAGKTGTTNDSLDAWFVGFSPDMAVGVYVGYDKPKTLGKKATGSSVALPIWVEFMQGALADKSAIPFRTPSGVRLVNVDAESGLLPSSSTKTIIAEAFLPGTEPTSRRRARPAGLTTTGNTDQRDLPALPSSSPSTGGLY